MCTCPGRCEMKNSINPERIIRCKIIEETAEENPEAILHRLLSIHGATELFRALSSVAMLISTQTTNGHPARTHWLALSARLANMQDAAQRNGLGSPFVMRRDK